MSSFKKERSSWCKCEKSIYFANKYDWVFINSMLS